MGSCISNSQPGCYMDFSWISMKSSLSNRAHLLVMSVPSPKRMRRIWALGDWQENSWENSKTWWEHGKKPSILLPGVTKKLQLNDLLLILPSPSKFIIAWEPSINSLDINTWLYLSLIFNLNLIPNLMWGYKIENYEILFLFPCFPICAFKRLISLVATLKVFKCSLEFRLNSPKSYIILIHPSIHSFIMLQHLLNISYMPGIVPGATAT